MNKKNELHLTIENKYGNNIVLECGEKYLIADGNEHLMIHVGGSEHINNELDEFKNRLQINSEQNIIKYIVDMVGELLDKYDDIKTIKSKREKLEELVDLSEALAIKRLIELEKGDIE